jgi:hypothetical protein
MESCPRVQVTMDDPQFCHRLLSIERIGAMFAIGWFHARQDQVRFDIAGMMFASAPAFFAGGFRAGLVAAGAQPDATTDGRVQEIDAESAKLAAKAIAQHDKVVANLKGLYAGLERFCTAVDLPIKDFLALAPSAIRDIAASRVLVDNDMEPDADVADDFYAACCQAWPEPVAAPASTPVGRPERRPRRRATRTAKQIRPRDRAPLTAVRTTSEELRIPSPAQGEGWVFITEDVLADETKPLPEVIDRNWDVRLQENPLGCDGKWTSCPASHTRYRRDAHRSKRGTSPGMHTTAPTPWAPATPRTTVPARSAVKEGLNKS